MDERAVTPGTAPAVVEDHPLMRMRDPGSVTLIPGQDTLARALGPVEAPAGPEKPARRKPRLPGTGLTCYRFAAKVWRTRPDLTNLSLPFKLNFKSSVRLVTYQKLGS